ncbi:MAG: hypothetical protein CK424_01395 [Legionella sp.]|nr:MAG: hypothetical protein CK424_01395 [Legionella sp.]
MENQFDTAIAIDLLQHYYAYDSTKTQLCDLWKTWPPHVLQSFITEQEAQIYQDLIGSVDEPDVKPWTSVDMNRYYSLRDSLDKSGLYAQMTQRRQQLIVGATVTIFDELQLTRETEATTKLKNASNTNEEWHKLQLLSDAKVIVNSNESQTSYFFDALLHVLAIYKVQLHTPTADVDLIFKIDNSLSYIADYFNDIILSDHLEENRVNIEEKLTQLGDLNQEIFPWLSVFFRRELLNLSIDDAKVDHHIDSFLKFHTFINKKSLEEMLSNLMGLSTKVTYKQFLKAERQQLQCILDTDTKNALKNMTYYLRGSVTSPWIVEQLLMYIKEQPHNAEVGFLSFQLIELVYRNPQLFMHSYDYLTGLKAWDCQPNSTKIKKMQWDHPSYLIALLKHDPQRQIEAIDLAFSMRVLPPSATFIYAMWQKHPKKTTAIIQHYQDHFPALLHDIWLHIFSNEEELVDQNQLLRANVHPSITKIYAPLFALRQAIEHSEPLPETWVITLWKGLLESGLLDMPRFLQSEKNQQVVTTLQNITDFAKNVPLTLAQTKTLCTLLAVYRATQLEPHDTEPYTSYSIFFRPPTIEYKDESSWADHLYFQLLCTIAWSQNRFDFDNIIRFLDIELNPPSHPISIENLHETMVHDIQIRNSKHQNTNYNHQEKLLHSFLELYLEILKRHNVTKKSYISSLFHELPSLALHIFDIGAIEQFVAIPCWLPSHAQQQIVTIMHTPFQQQSIAATFMSPIDIDELDESFLSRFNPKIQHSRTQNIGYFISQLYIAYCKQHQNILDPNCRYKKFVQLETLKETVSNEAQAIEMLTKNIRPILMAHHNNCHNYTGWWAWVSWFLGYHLERSIAQLDHYKTIKNFLNQHDIRSLQECRSLITTVNEAIANKTFKEYFWLNSFYHNYLVDLHQKLLHLERKLTIEPTQPVQTQTTESYQEAHSWVRDTKPSPSLGSTPNLGLYQNKLLRRAYSEPDLRSESQIDSATEKYMSWS